MSKMKLSIKKPSSIPNKIVEQPPLEIVTNNISTVKSVKNNKTIREPNTRVSNFFITVNTNKSMWNKPPEEVLQHIKDFEDKIDVFLNNDLMNNLLDLNDSKEAYGTKYQDIPLLQRFITQFDNNGNQLIPNVDYCTEIGDEKGFLHSHMVLRTKHRALNCRLHYKNIDKYWKEKLGGQAYVHVDLVRDSNQTLLDYMTKQNQKYKF